MLVLLLRTAHASDTGQYVLDETYELSAMQEVVDSAIDRGQPFRVLLDTGNPLVVNPQEYRVVAVVEQDRLQTNRNRFRWK